MQQVSFNWNAVAHISDLLIFDDDHCDMEVNGDPKEITIRWF